VKVTVMKTELSNLEIALYALYRLGGATRRMHTEKIAWEAFQLAKVRFSWRLPEFRDKGFPDKTPVRYALEQAKKNKNGALVTGRAGGDIGGKELEGWQLTSRGVAWIKSNETRIMEALEQQETTRPKIEAARFLKRVRGERLYRHYQNNGTLEGASAYWFADMLICAPDASKDIMSKKLEQMIAKAEWIGERNVVAFLEACRSTFIQV